MCCKKCSFLWTGRVWKQTLIRKIPKTVGCFASQGYPQIYTNHIQMVIQIILWLCAEWETNLCISYKGWRHKVSNPQSALQIPNGRKVRDSYSAIHEMGKGVNICKKVNTALYTHTHTHVEGLGSLWCSHWFTDFNIIPHNSLIVRIKWRRSLWSYQGKHGVRIAGKS